MGLAGFGAKAVSSCGLWDELLEVHSFHEEVGVSGSGGGHCGAECAPAFMYTHSSMCSWGWGG